jgi:hypothetical protein
MDGSLDSIELTKEFRRETGNFCDGVDDDGVGGLLKQQQADGGYSGE